MQMFCLPGFERQLLVELQRQQNDAQFCDTLLHSEGISVPTHSCVLAALSPYLSQKLSAAPSPPPGQKHHLRLRAVNATTMLKLVRLLYSGNLEVNDGMEQRDVLAIVRRFGIAGLVRRKEADLLDKRKDLGFHDNQRGKTTERTQTLDAQVQAEIAEKMDTVERRSTGTQTNKEGQKAAFTSLPTGLPSNEESPLKTVDSTFTTALNNPLSDALRDEDGVSCTQVPELEDGSQVYVKHRAYVEIGERHLEAGGVEQSSRPQEDEMLGDEVGKSTGARCDNVSVGMSSVRRRNPSQQMMEAAHISIKVKLRRSKRIRTGGEAWEVVNMQKTNESMSVLSSKKQDGSHPTGPNTELANQPSPAQNLQNPYSFQPGTNNTPKAPSHANTFPDSLVPLNVCFTSEQIPTVPDTNLPDVAVPPSTDATSPGQNPDTCLCQAATNNSPKSPLQPHTSDSQASSNDCFTSDQSQDPLLQSRGSVESGEQIEKLLEDFIMGLNILPNPEGDPTSSQRVQPTMSQAPHAEPGLSHRHNTARAAGPGSYRDMGASTDAGILGCSAWIQPTWSGFSPGPADAASVRQKQECFLEYRSPGRSTWNRAEIKHQGIPPSKSQKCLPCDTPRLRCGLSSTLSSNEPRITYPSFTGPSLQDTEPNLEVLPPTKVIQSMHNLPLLCLADLQLPGCLSPLPPCSPFPERQPAPLRPLWITEKPGSVQIPQSTLQETEKSPSPEITVPRKTCKRLAKRASVAPKRRKPNPRNASTHSVHSDTDACDEAKNPLNMNICRVNLSCNNVLAKKRAEATCVMEKTTRSGETAEQHPIITRKKTRQGSNSRNRNTEMEVVSPKQNVGKVYEPEESVNDTILVVEKRGTTQNQQSDLSPKLITKIHSKTRSKERRKKKKENSAETEEMDSRDGVFKEQARSSPERSGPARSDAGGISRPPPRCVEEEEEEEEEVDVLLCSPVKVHRPCGIHRVEVIPDPEDEDMGEIDVIGDEAG